LAHEIELRPVTGRFQGRGEVRSGFPRDKRQRRLRGDHAEPNTGDRQMSNDRINADFSQRVVIATNDLPWIPSPQAGVERRMLDRIGSEVARATSLVRYAAASTFPAHGHALGEEFLVLEGVFSDEHGDYPPLTYVRNPPLSHHSPRTAPGCTILVKLRQMALSETTRLVVDSTTAKWHPAEQAGLTILPLFQASGAMENVALERLEAGAVHSEMDCPGGEEIFILSGDLRDQNGTYGAGTWIRNPAGVRHSLGSASGATYWVKRGHLCPDGMTGTP
jgi:anti-sigma factor ChrR (cupin superfamily)